MFWGISAFNVSRGVARDFNFKSDYYSGGGNVDTSYSTNIGTYDIRLDYFFIAVRGCNVTNN